MNKPSHTLSIKVRKEIFSHSIVGVYRELYFTEPGLGIPTLVPFKPALRSHLNEMAASIHRYGCQMPNIHAGRQFVAYARAVIKKIFTPVQQVCSWDEYIANTSYSAKRREYFTQLRERTDEITASTRRVKAFIKDEGYASAKNARAILSPSDESKVILGPIVHAMDKATFELDCFVKGSNPSTWPARLREKFGEDPVYCTDFSSFEAHHRNAMCDVVWAWMDHMTHHLQGFKPHRTLMRAMVYSRNEIDFPCTGAAIDQRLMSGALWTSSSNGVLNLMTMSYLSLRGQHPSLDGAELAAKWCDFNGLVEGDDGICAAVSPIDPEDIKRIGAKLKIEREDSVDVAGFCSNYFDMASLTTVRDPYKVLMNFPVLQKELADAKKSTHLGMLRAKAMSLKYQAPDCPVLGPLADAVLRLTAGHDVRHARARLDQHARGILDAATSDKMRLRTPAQITPTSRMLVEKLFKMDVACQLELEKKFETWAGGPIEISLLHKVHPQQLDHALNFLSPQGVPLLVREPNRNFCPLIHAFESGKTDLARSKIPTAAGMSYKPDE